MGPVDKQWHECTQLMGLSNATTEKIPLRKPNTEHITFVVPIRDLVHGLAVWLRSDGDSHDSAEQIFEVLAVVVRVCLLRPVADGPIEVVPGFL